MRIANSPRTSSVSPAWTVRGCAMALTAVLALSTLSTPTQAGPFRRGGGSSYRGNSSGYRVVQQQPTYSRTAQTRVQGHNVQAGVAVTPGATGSARPGIPLPFGRSLQLEAVVGASTTFPEGWRAGYSAGTQYMYTHQQPGFSPQRAPQQYRDMTQRMAARGWQDVVRVQVAQDAAVNGAYNGVYNAARNTGYTRFGRNHPRVERAFSGLRGRVVQNHSGQIRSGIDQGINGQLNTLERDLNGVVDFQRTGAQPSRFGVRLYGPNGQATGYLGTNSNLRDVAASATQWAGRTWAQLPTTVASGVSSLAGRAVSALRSSGTAGSARSVDADGGN